LNEVGRSRVAIGLESGGRLVEKSRVEIEWESG
jgi:hypothetical protein